MDINPLFEKIEAYLQGELDANEKSAFEAEVAHNDDLALEVRRQLLLKEALIYLQREKTRQSIKNWRKAGKTTLFYNQLAVAASLALAVVFAMYWFFSSPQLDNQALANRYYELDEDVFVSVRSADVELPFQKAMEALEKKDYQAAILWYAEEKDQDAALYGLGHAYFLAKDYKKAVQSFQELKARNNLDFNEKSNWYLTLSYLAAGEPNDIEMATELLHQIARKSGTYQKPATALLQKWKS